MDVPVTRPRKHWTRRALIAAGGTLAAGGAAFAGFGAFARTAAPWFWERYQKERVRSIGPAPHRPDPKAWPDRGLFAAWLGHATVLVKIDGFTLITDPQFSDYAGIHVGPLFSLGFKRLVEPALRIEDLPPLDLILMSHAHMDHWDTKSLHRLKSKRTAVVTAAKTADLLNPRRYASVTEIGWDQRTRVGPAEIRAFEVRHWGARLRHDTWRGYNGYVIEAAGRRILFGGDTAYTRHFASVRTSRPFDLAIMPIGCYDPWHSNHCNPEEAWQMGQMARAERYLPIHHQTFLLSNEPLLEPIERFLEAARGENTLVPIQGIGQEWRYG
ncbi:MAG: MBL fold metallo-hydrolase [Bryobacteraceae bacterium]|nr:MBL fold metallo-hydrolase [Bryobacteraceae bacterium]